MGGERLELGQERGIVRVADAVHEVDVAGPVPEALGHRADRGNADAAGDQEQLPAGAPRAMHGAVRALEHQRRAGPEGPRRGSPRRTP